MSKTLKRIALQAISSIIPIDKISFKYPVSIKGVLIEDGRLLTVTTEKNKIDIPGGKLEYEDNSMENRLVKEFKSETNLSVEVIGILDVVIRSINGVQVLVIIYQVKNIGTEPIILTYENNDYYWLEISRIDKELNWLVKSVSRVKSTNFESNFK